MAAKLLYCTQWRIRMATLTVFTPAYNRAHTLPRTYESLQKQSCKDFVWLIVDDGSKDQTAKIGKRVAATGKKRLKSDISIKKMAGCIRRIM